MVLLTSTVMELDVTTVEPLNRSSKFNQNNKILLVGLFLSEKNKTKILRTAADQLGELFDNHGIHTLKVSCKLNQLARFADTLFCISRDAGKFNVAIVPLYGGNKNYIWQAATITLLRLLRKKIILIVHGGSIPMRMETSARKYLKLFNQVDKVICPSTFIASSLERHGVQAGIVENVVNLRDYTFHYKSTFGPRILWMRTLEDIYNPEMAVEVAAILVKKYPELRMVMAGHDRGSLTAVKQLIDKYNLHTNIELPGYITNQQKNVYAGELDMYICTNRVDNAPVSFIEMMALGLPIISVNVGGIPYLVQDDVNELLVPPDDVMAMAEKIIGIIEQPGLGERLAANGGNYAKQFDEEPVLQKWLRVFEELDASPLENSRKHILPQ
jgi:glycosyltransferase involved in cell wall biosynthesis